MKARVRGIYTTALTKLLLDNDFEIVLPSLTIKKRFNLSENSASPDLMIKDRYDLQGIRVLGTAEAVCTFQSVLQSTFEDVLTRKWLVSVNGTYKGNVLKSNEYALHVDIGGGVVGKVPKHEIANMSEKQIIVQVERRRLGARQPILTTNLKVVGDCAILVQNSKTGVSLKIRDLTKRTELYALGKTLAPNGWGIIWRESSANQSKETLEKEIGELINKVKIINEKALSANAPALLVEGSYFMDAEFPFFSKRNMDVLRGSMAPTLDGHHFYKSCGGTVSAILEMVEKLLEKGQNPSEVEESFQEQIRCEFPEVGSTVDVEHVKLSGTIFHLGQAIIEGFDNGQVKYTRVMRSNGFYDGLGVGKEAGDKAVSETRKKEWCTVTRYLSEDGVLKGTYVNLNTPVEVYPNAIRYVDLEVDVCIHPDGTIKVLDMEKWQNAYEKGVISKKLFEMVKAKAETIAKDKQ